MIPLHKPHTEWESKWIDLKELEQACLRSKSFNSQNVMLVVVRKRPPSEDFIRVKGLGKGIVLNAKKSELNPNHWEICAMFRADTILKTIERANAQQAIEEDKDK